MCLERLRAIALEHGTCTTERPRIDGAELVIPFDVRQADGSWTIEYQRIHNRQELLDALGY